MTPRPQLKLAGILTAGHAGETAGVVEAVQSLAGVICSVHTFPTFHTRSYQGDTNDTFIGGGQDGPEVGGRGWGRPARSRLLRRPRRRPVIKGKLHRIRLLAGGTDERRLQSRGPAG